MVSPEYDTSQLDDSERELVDELLVKKGYNKLFEVQQKALDENVLRTDENLIIIAPTASGKTLAAEFLIYKCLIENGKVIYLVPTNSLVTDKENELKYLEKEYKIASGRSSPKTRSECDIWITPFETFYKTALLNTDLVTSFNLAVIDEFHILYDKLRGFTLEKVMTMLNMLNIRILCLSATFEDKKEIAGWLDAQIIDIPEELRVVPLEHSIIPFSSVEGIYTELMTRNLGPYIIFCSTREYCKNRAILFAENTPDTRKPVIEIFDEIRDAVNGRSLTSLEQELGRCISKSVGFHHSGFDSRIKKLVEDKFLNKEIEFLFATTGLAYGMNLPARSVVLFDMKMYDPLRNVSSYIPVYLYQQMAGRAGRPKFGSDGYSFIITRNKTDETAANDYYFKGALDRAVSHIAEDAYFRKAILELIYSTRGRPEEILTFFKKTFYNYQSKNVESPFSVYNLNGIIRGHIIYLESRNFLQYLGAPGYRLTKLGQVTLDFLFNTFSTYDLDVFLSLDKYVEGIEELNANLPLIHIISQLFFGARLSKYPRKKNETIEKFYEKRGIDSISHAEYSAYAIWNGWIENWPVEAIEESFLVYSSHIGQVARELHALLTFSEKLAEIKNIPISSEFSVFTQRILRGYREEELPFSSLRGFRRVLLRNIHNYCHDVLTRPPLNCKGTTIEILRQLKGLNSKDEFIRVLSNIENISQVRATRIYEFI